MRAFDARSIAVVPYFESALYRMSDDDLTPERVLALARDTERRVLGIESPRPLLAIPHLLNQESAASYQGYLLALHGGVADARALPARVRLSSPTTPRSVRRSRRTTGSRATASITTACCAA